MPVFDRNNRENRPEGVFEDRESVQERSDRASRLSDEGNKGGLASGGKVEVGNTDDLARKIGVQTGTQVEAVMHKHAAEMEQIQKNSSEGIVGALTKLGGDILGSVISEKIKKDGFGGAFDSLKSGVNWVSNKVRLGEIFKAKEGVVQPPSPETVPQTAKQDSDAGKKTAAPESNIAGETSAKATVVDKASTAASASGITTDETTKEAIKKTVVEKAEERIEPEVRKEKRVSDLLGRERETAIKDLGKYRPGDVIPRGAETVEHPGLEGAKVVESEKGVKLARAAGPKPLQMTEFLPTEGVAAAGAGEAAAGAGLGMGEMAGLAGIGAATAGIGAVAVLGAQQLSKGMNNAADVGTKPLAAASGLFDVMGGGSGEGGVFGKAASVLPSGSSMPGGDLLKSLGIDLFGPLDKLKSAAAGVADSFVNLVAKGVDPATNYIQRWTGMFQDQVAKFNPALIERFNLSLDNLTAAAGSMFTPIIEEATKFANDLNVLYTQIAEPIRGVVGSISTQLADFGRGFFQGVQEVVAATTEAVKPLLDGLSGTGAEIGGIFRGVMHHFVGIAQTVITVLQPAFYILGFSLQTTIGIVRLFGQAVSSSIAVIGEMTQRAVTFNFAGTGRQSLADIASAAANSWNPTNTPLQGAMTVAAHPARQIGLEDIGQQARAAAFSQGMGAADRTAQATEATASASQTAANYLSQLVQLIQNQMPQSGDVTFTPTQS